MIRQMTYINSEQEKLVTYDDTRDIAIRCVNKLIESQAQRSIIFNDEHNFEIQDLIHDEINEVLGLDIDDNFEIKILVDGKTE